MKCPYMQFSECIKQACPSCNYEKIERKEIAGRFPMYMSTEDAIKNGMAWDETKIEYKFVSCKLVDNNVRPPSIDVQEIKNISRTNVSIHKSIF